MKALAEKLAKLFLVLLFLIGIEGIDVHAAVSYPNMLPDAETVGCEIKSGEIAQLKFTVVKGTSYSSVKYFVEVYDSDSKTTKVAESQGAVTENITNLTVEWDTSDVIPGTYTVQYYVQYYYRSYWRTVPSGKRIFHVKVLANGENVINPGVGSMISAPNEIQSGVTYTKYWTRDNYTEHCYNHIYMAQDGYLQIEIDRPVDYSGIYRDLTLTVYNADQNAIWKHYTYYVDKATGKLVYKVGVSAGSYYFDISLRYSTTVMLTSTFKVTGVAADYEKESNETLNTATHISANRIYGANFATTSGDTDCFAFDVRQGVPATVRIGNYSSMEGTTALLHIFDSNGNILWTRNETYNVAENVYELPFKPTVSGTYYFKIYNTHGEPIDYTIEVRTQGAVDQNSSVNGLAQASDGNWYLYKNGKVQESYNDLYHDATYGWWKVMKGKIDFSYTDLYNSPTCGWWKIKGGAVDFSYSDLYNSPTCGWWKIKGGAVDFSYSDLYNSPTCGWWKIKGGAVEFNYNNLYNSATCGWWKVTGGRVDFKFSGFQNYENKWYYLKNGTVNWSYTGLALYNKTWYYVERGLINWKYTGFTNYGGTSYYVQNGCLNWNYTGLGYDNGTWRMVVKGVRNTDYTGLIQYAGTWYYVQKGVLYWGCDGLVQHNGDWYYIENSAVNWNYTGLVQYGKSWYYVQKGFLNWNFSDDVWYNGSQYKVQNGVMVG